MRAARFVVLPASALSLTLGCSQHLDEEVNALRQRTSGLPVIDARVETAALHGYDDAPRTPDADDPAIWVNPSASGEGLVLGVLKDAGLQVHDLEGNVVQTILPPYRPAVTAQDPPVPGTRPEGGTGACPGSASGETYSRFNNVDVQYGFELIKANGSKETVDIAVVTDRGCDRLRIYAIKPQSSSGPLIDITASSAPRVFPGQFVQPSSLQPTGESPGVHDNDLDDQNTAYGLALHRLEDDDDGYRAFVTQRNRSVVAELALYAAGNGEVSYSRVRELRFNPVFAVPGASAGSPSIQWTPCREEPESDPQFEGLVVDQREGVLFAAQEVVGVWRVPLNDALPATVTVPASRLVERARSFGEPWWAVPDDGEYACEDSAPGTPVAGTIAAPGNPSAGGLHLERDVEGLAIYYGEDEEGYLLVSSQGDDTFHVYDREDPTDHIAAFQVEGTGETDGHDVVNVPAGIDFPHGLFVVQNGQASGPSSEDPINGFDYDGSTQFKLLGWEDIADELDLDVEEDEYDPRDPHDD
ncbi:phytase [Sorangium sp. So ce1099]|uniref:phytase n=1 Tax=Sorangium sp. So ce1099 TaxID=3133331 RepID=UPI003F5EEC03